MSQSDVKVCPLCGKCYSERPALSRADNKTEICPDCGMLEALNIAIANDNRLNN